MAIVLVCALGCDRTGPATGGTGGTGAPASAPAAATASPLMRPFQGHWKFDLSKTLALWQAEGVPAGDIAQVKTLATAITIHHDMTIAGDAALFSGSPQGSYDFFAMHTHQQWACGKAWLHEDRNDPGDMSKCYARLQLTEEGRELHLSTRMHDDDANPNDPDIANMPAAAGSAASCGADAAPHPPWSPWRTYVFVRG